MTTPKSKRFFLALFLSFTGLLTAVQVASPQSRPRSVTRGAEDRVPSRSRSSAARKEALRDLSVRISEVLGNPVLRRGRIGAKIVSLKTGETIYEKNADKFFMPASNLKSLTVAAAIERLGPDHRIVTNVYAGKKPDQKGILRGDLIVFGRGDPSLSPAFNEGEDYVVLDALAEKIYQAGIRRIDGDVVGDESYFDTKPVPYGWEWEDLQWYYGAEISALSVNDNRIELSVRPRTVGTPCEVAIYPGSRLIRIINRTKTAAKGEKRTLRITKKLSENLIEVSGAMPEGDSGFKGNISVSGPAAFFADLLRQRLTSKGIEIKGRSRSVSRMDRGGLELETEGLFQITSIVSPPLRVIAEKIMKPSQNLYTELLLRSLGEALGDPVKAETTSEQKGVEVIRSFLEQNGIDPDEVLQYDGSGLSRHNLLTPNLLVGLFSYMSRSRYGPVWRDSLTIGAVDGTLEKRFVRTAAAANVRGKTGTLDQVSALSGYVASGSGERFVFSIIVNNIPDSRTRIAAIDAVVVLLAEFENNSATGMRRSAVRFGTGMSRVF